MEEKVLARGAKTSKGAAGTVLSIGVAARPVPPHYEGWNVLVGGDQPAAKPDVALSLRNLKAQPGGEYDAVYCAYALQTCYAHEVGGVVEGLRVNCPRQMPRYTLRHSPAARGAEPEAVTQVVAW